MANKENILKKFNDKDSKFMASKIIDNYYSFERTGQQIVSDFLTPNFMSQMLEELEREFKIFSLKSFGGYENAERRCIVFNDCDDSDTSIVRLKITNNTKFCKDLEHREVLGSILGLGLNRSKIGDIVFEKNNCYVFVKNDVVDFILYNLEFVGRSKVKVEISEYLPENFENNEDILTTTISSLRIDTIISNITNLSRNDVKKLFDKELIFINWKVCKNASQIVKEKDLITIRKYGRIRIVEIKGFSKKGKQIIDYTRTTIRKAT